MKRQYKFYILFLICLIILPSTVSAHTIILGKQTQSNNKTTIPVTIKAEGDINESSTFTLNCETNTTNTRCEMSFGGDGIGSTGVVIKPISSGQERQIGTITVTNDTYTASIGKFTLSGNAAGSAINTTSDFSVGAKAALKATATYSSVKPSQGTMYPEFNKDVYEYTIYNLKDTINSITINTVCDGCTSKKNKADDWLDFTYRTNQLIIKDLKSGNNSIEINTLSEDGTNSKLYTFTIIRGETEYDSAKLASLSIGDYKLSPEFTPDTKEYTLSVPYTVKDLTTLIQTTLKDTNAEVEITGADSLKEGTNEVVIKITSINKDNTMEYKITVTRLSSDDIILISYKDKKITFKDADDKKQTLDEEEFKEKYPTVWEDIQAKKYKFDEEGNLITDEDKEDNKKKKDNKVIIVVIIIVVAIILIGGSGYFLFRKKDPEKEEKKKEEKIKKKAEKKARKDKLKKMEEEYYNEYYGEDDEYEDEDETDEESEESSEDEEEDFEIKDKDKLKKEEAKSLLEDDYIFESSLVEEENDEENDEEDEEEDTRAKRHKDDVVDIDSALEDLMNTKTYDFSDELKDVNKINEDDEEDEY